jgi:hypothetical protein
MKPVAGTGGGTINAKRRGFTENLGCGPTREMNFPLVALSVPRERNLLTAIFLFRMSAKFVLNYLQNGEIALNLTAEKLFKGNQVRAFMAALFAGTKIKMHQKEFYGEIFLQCRTIQ